jgi:hypothetical protein
MGGYRVHVPSFDINSSIPINNIPGTGRISTLFVRDLIASQRDPSNPVRHIVQAIGTSSQENGGAFVESVMSGVQRPKVHAECNDPLRGQPSGHCVCGHSAFPSHLLNNTTMSVCFYNWHVSLY